MARKGEKEFILRWRIRESIGETMKNGRWEKSQTIVKRMPIELEKRLGEFRIAVAAKEGKLMNETDTMRKFAEMSITGYDDLGKAIKNLGRSKI